MAIPVHLCILSQVTVHFLAVEPAVLCFEADLEIRFLASKNLKHQRWSLEDCHNRNLTRLPHQGSTR